MNFEENVLDDVIDELFAYWSEQGDGRWATYVWGLLASVGQVPAALEEADVDFDDHMITIRALALFSDSFNTVRETGSDLDVEVRVEVGAADIDDMALGRWCERRGIAPLEQPEDRGATLRAALDARLVTLRPMLEVALGGTSPLFASMWGQTSGEPYPLPPEVESEIIDVVTADRGATYAWLTN